MASNSDSGDFNIGFFAVRETTDKKGYISGILVTDSKGIPTEFRCTHPVRPTTAQRALYGNTLEDHVTIELCGKPLIESLTTSPIGCLVESRKIVALRELVSLPVLHIERLGDALTVDNETLMSGTARLDNNTLGYQPLSVHCFSGFESDLSRISQIDQIGDWRSLETLQYAAYYTDINGVYALQYTHDHRY